MADDRQESSWTARLVRFLTQSGYSPLVLVGRAIENLGMAVVIAFLLGAAAAFAAIWKWPSLAPGAAPRQESARLITLAGSITNIDNEPLGRFKVALQGREFGPFDGGKFELPSIPAAPTYTLIVRPEQGYPTMVYGDRVAVLENKEQNRYRLETPIQNFPNRLGRVGGMLVDQNGRAIIGEVEVAGRVTAIKGDGSFEITDIPLGTAPIVVRDKNGNPLRNETIQIELNTLTPFNRQIKVSQ